MSTKRALIVIDMSVEQVANLTYNKQGVVDAIHQLAASGKFDLVLDCHLWIGPNDKTSLTTLYPDVGRKDTCGALLIPEFQKCSSKWKGYRFVPKYNYSAFVDSSLADILRSEGIKEVYLTGINTDYCIFATALDAFYMHLDVYVVEDAVSSVCGREGHRQGLRLISKFGCGNIVGSQEALAKI